MKKNINRLFVAGCLLLIGSCKKSFLDKAPGVDVTESTVFASKVNLDLFLNTLYKNGVHSNFRYRDQQNFNTTVNVGGATVINNTDCIHPSASYTDEGDASEADFVSSNVWNKGGVVSSNFVNNEDYRYYIRWIALRQVALILKRIDEVPDADAAYKNQVKAEVKVIRAMNYLEMIKRYGGVPIVDSMFAAGVQIDAPRRSFEDCVNFIVKDCNDAINNNDLPAAQSVVLKGRINKATAYAVKAKTLLYAASPQFNTATPFLSMDNAANNKLICYGNYDVSRWQKAADATKEALDYLAGNGYTLIDVPAARNPPQSSTGYIGNYRNSWEQYNNAEIIFGYQGNNVNNTGNAPLTFINPTCYGSFWSGISVPLNFIRKYEDTLGNMVTWGASGGTNLLDKYGQLDPRFKQTIDYTGSYYNASYPISEIYIGGKHYGNCKGGNWMHKYIPYNLSGNVFLNDVLFRVNELYLNYAEVLNELSGPGAYSAPTLTTPAQVAAYFANATAYPTVPTSAYDIVNKIRLRSGMRPLPPNLSQSEFRLRLRNERSVELVMDDQRLWDVRRWGIAQDEGVMQGKFDGLQINKVGSLYSWQVYTFETRVFNTNMYLHPFPQTEVLKGNLIQNPGWQ